MIKIKAKITEEVLNIFKEETGQELEPYVELNYTLNEDTGDYYLAFVNDLIVVYNNVLTLDQGLITPTSLSYLDELKKE